VSRVTSVNNPSAREPGHFLPAVLDYQDLHRDRAEHFSTMMDSHSKLKGFANMTLNLVGKPLPTLERTREIAVAFLQKTAPNLLIKMQVSWSAPQDDLPDCS
jgi:hypothetical protein